MNPAIENYSSGSSLAGVPGEVWQCPSCGVRNNGDLCICRRSKPMSTKGFPQIFKGYFFHFNGIIPRTLKHPSHSIEWRMAEAHGAGCSGELITEGRDQTTHLIYRPGYERSDKVRAAFRARVPCMPIKWMLDSLLNARELHQSLYRLVEIPEEALPTSNSTVLQHHQHAYFMQNYTAFIPEGVQSNAAVGSAASQMQTALMNRTQKAMKTEPPPQLEPIPTLVPRVRGSVLVTNPSVAARSLLRGITLGFASTELEGEAAGPVPAHGGVLVTNVAETPGALQQLTHLIFTSADKKSDVMIAAVGENIRRSEAGETPIVLVASNWLLDGMYLESLPPPLGPYAATEKLISTLTKKLQKRGS